MPVPFWSCPFRLPSRSGTDMLAAVSGFLILPSFSMSSPARMTSFRSGPSFAANKPS